MRYSRVEIMPAGRIIINCKGSTSLYYPKLHFSKNIWARMKGAEIFDGFGVSIQWEKTLEDHCMNDFVLNIEFIL